MNRAARRAQGNRGPATAAAPRVTTPATPDDAKRFIDQAFTDRISWTAARVLLTRVVADPAAGQLDAEVRAAIDRFLERHPDPMPAEAEA